MKRPQSDKKKNSVEKSKNVKPKMSGLSKKDNDVYQYESDKIRNQKDRAGDVSDDSDGEFKGDDESIDDDGSEVGWDSDDEMAYGNMFKSKKSAMSSSSFQSDDSESDQEEACEGEVLLSDLFTTNKKPVVTTGKSSSSKAPEEEDDVEAFDSEDLSENEEDGDEEGDNDGEEEEKEESDDEDGSDEDDEDDDDDDEEAHNRLINAIDKFSKVSENEPEAKRKKISNQSAQESIFSSLADDEAVSMDALLGALGEAKGLNVVKKQLTDLEKGTSVPSYVEKVVADRIERSLAYDGTSLEMGKWQESVTTNRNARTLDLAQDKRLQPNYKDLVMKFVPRTDMEREVQMILVKTGATDDLAEKREEDELGSRNFSIEEMKERQAELAKVKALMFYEQMKRHRLNKIKSKAYRRIRKRQKNKLDADEKGDLADMDPELAREEEEKEALRQVKERMDMKHKNTGKWARMALQHGHHDESLRLAYHESVQLGHELSKRIHEDPSSSRRRPNKEDGGDSSADEEEFETELSGKKKKVSEKAAREMLSVLEGAEDEPEAQGKYKKLFEMDFMKRASDQKKEKSREEAQSILRELQGMESCDSGDDEDVPAAVAVKVKDSAALIAARAAMKQQLGQGAGMTLRGGSKKVSVSGPISVKGAVVKVATIDTDARWVTEDVVDFPAAVPVDDGLNPWLAAPTSSKKRDSSGLQVAHAKGKQGDKLYVSVADIAVTATSAIVQSNAGKKGNTKQLEKQANAEAVGQKRPLPATVSLAPSKQEKKSKVGKNSSLATSSQAGAALAPVSVITSVSGTTSAAPAKDRKPLLMQKSQDDLVQMAFAGPDFEEDFALMKGAAIDQELGIDEKRNKILSDVKAGWGDWAGPGASGVSTKILDHRNRLLKKVDAETAEKKKGRTDTKIPNVMISDRRVKTAAKYKISEIPHPFTSREEYERSMQMPLGAEWNASSVVKASSVPDVLLRAGRIVQPIALTKSQAKAAQREKAPLEDGDKKKMNRTITGNKKHKK